MDTTTKEFYDYVRGITDKIPAGHTKNGLDVYRYLVYLGAVQMINSQYPDLKEQLGKENFEVLIKEFIKTSKWKSNFYADMIDDFNNFLTNQTN